MDISTLQQEPHIKDYIDVIRRRRDIVILFFVTTVLVVTIGSFLMKPVYRATTTLLIDPESPNVLTATGTIEMQSENYLSYKEYYQSQVEIMTSYSLAKKVFDEFGLGKTREYAKAKEPVKSFLKTIKVDPVRDTRLVRLSVDNKAPELAANIANRIAELYVMRNLYYISKSEILNLLKNEYLKLEARLSEYAKVYKDAHPEMIRLKNEMADMLDKIAREKKSMYNYDDIEKYLKQTPGTSGSHSALAGFKANNISIQDEAEKPVVPVKPKKRLNILLAIIVGAFGGVGLAFLFEYMDDTVKAPEEIEKIVKWPFLGSIPVIDSDNTLKELEKDIFVHIKPKDPIAEVYRIIRTRLLFSSTEAEPLKSILFSSPGPQEGKTMTLCNLAIALAQNQKRVLVIDADMRKPRLHEVFKKENKNGLSNVLAGQALLKDVIQKTEIENLSLVTGGVLPPNPAELLESGKAKDVIAKAKENFDFVLFDSPPMAMLTDSIILSRIVDGTIIVIESGKTSKRILARLYQLLGDAKAKVIGMIFNKISLNTTNQYYYSYYYGKS